MIASAPRPAGPAPRLAIVVGTRPEAIKLAPLAIAARKSRLLTPVVIATGQHDELVTSALGSFGVAVDHRIELDARRGGSQAELLAHLLPLLDEAFDELRPAAAVVQGDTASAVGGAMVATWRACPLAHLEAGLRSHDKANPFPEETYRRIIAAMADLHLAPTPWAAANLRAEGIAEHDILCVGNTVVDAAQQIEAAVHAEVGAMPTHAAGRRLVLVTVHRRENWGAPLAGVLDALKRLVERVPDIEIVLPVHPNPIVRGAVLSALGSLPQIRVVDPLDYPSFIRHLAAATLVLSDSGGVQEEAPAFGVPVLVLRETTERPEAVEAGTAELVGTDPDTVLSRAVRLLTDETARSEMTRVSNPFGDGASGPRSVEAIASLLGIVARPEPWSPVALQVVGSSA